MYKNIQTALRVCKVRIKHLIRDVHHWRTFIAPRSLAVVAALIAATAAAAAARTPFARIARIFAESGPFGGHSDILAIFFLVQLGRIGKQMQREFEKLKHQ
jgi:hypothetical protein